MTTMRNGDMRTGIYIGCIAAAGAALIGWSVAQVARDGFETRLAAWAAIATLTVLLGSLSVRLPVRECRVSFSDALLFMSIVVFGPALATLTGALDGLASSTRRRGNWYKIVFNTGAMAISTHLSARLFQWAVPQDGLWSAQEISPLHALLPLLMVAAAQYAMNTAMVAGVIALKDGASFLSVVHETTPWAGTAHLLGAASVGLAMFAAHELGLITFVALLPFPAIVYVTYRSWLGRPVSDGKGD